MNDLVYVMYNLKLSNKQIRKTVDLPFDDIQSDDEWITEEGDNIDEIDQVQDANVHQTVNHIRSFILNKFTSSTYTLDNTIIHPWKKLYHFTRPPDPPHFHLLIQGLFVIACLFHSLPRYCMLWLDAPADSVSTPLWMKSLGLYCRRDG